jgi:hypothetical protein
MSSLPMPFRAAVGLAARAAEEARHLPDRAVELPMLAVSTVLQMSLRMQQRYAMLAAKGDEVLNRRPVSDEPPEWASFDDSPVSLGALLDAGELADGADEIGLGTPASPSAAGIEDPDDVSAAEPRKPKPGKTVRPPRNAAPSKFDIADDE